MNILVINCGSSSIKYKLFTLPRGYRIQSGVIERIGEKGSKVKDHYAGLNIILGKVKQGELIGHRVVHGAEKFKKPILI